MALGSRPRQVLIDERAVAQIADAGGAPSQEGAEHPGLGQRIKRHRRHVSRLL